MEQTFKESQESPKKDINERKVGLPDNKTHFKASKIKVV